MKCHFDKILNQLPAPIESELTVKKISNLCQDTKLEHESEDPDEFNLQMIERIAVGLVKTILLTNRPKK